MTDTHVVPNRQQYDEHTHQADMIPGVSISYQTAHQKTSFLRFLAHPASTLTIHLGERYKFYDHRTTTHTAMIQYIYQVDNNSNNDVVIYWTMTSIHVVPNRQQYIGLRPTSRRERGGGGAFDWVLFWRMLLSFLLWCSDDRRKNTRTRTLMHLRSAYCRYWGLASLSPITNINGT